MSSTNSVNDNDDRPQVDRATTASSDFLPTNPLRPPGWRWQRAGQLLGPRARLRRWDDGWVARARRFRADLAKVGGDHHHPRLARAHPSVLGAYHLRHGDPRRRWEVEARILAGQGDGDIAARLGVEAGVIGAYEALFFEVRGRLGCSDWVSACVLGGRLYEGFDLDDIEIVWKILAYHGGPVILDALIENTREDDRPPADPELAGQFELLITVMATPVTTGDALGWLRIDAKSREIDRSEAVRDASAVTKPIAIPKFEVRFGPATVPIAYAGCAPDEGEDAHRAMEGGPIELSDAG